MADQVSTQDTQTLPQDYSQLSQAHVPLEQAEGVFASKDASGRTPVVILTDRQNRVRNGLLLAAGIVLTLGLVLGLLRNNFYLIGLGVVLGLILGALAVMRSFRVVIPEGVNALLSQRGKYLRTIPSGSYFMPPYIRVTHLITRREIPFDVPVIETPTSDSVRANLDALVTFTIIEPYKFVYTLSANDFDHVFQAACQNGFRAMVRGVDIDHINDLTRQDTSELRAALSATVEPYGVSVMKVNIVAAQPPASFLASQEARQLAVQQQAEQSQMQSLALLRQADMAAIERQRVIAQVEQAREALQLQVQLTEARKRIVELEAEAEDLRLAKLEERLKKYPNAVEFEVQSAQLNIAHGLASNTRAIVQVGGASDITKAFLVSDIIQDASQDAMIPQVDGAANSKHKLDEKRD